MVRLTEDSFGCAMNPLTNCMENIRRFTLTNRTMSVQVITYGATITTICVPDCAGKVDDICLGFDNINGYQCLSNPYMGCIVGRVSSRVGNGKFQLNGQDIEVSKNFLDKHQLHGGFLGFDKVIWDVLRVRGDGVTFAFCSPDGHEGYPGQLFAKVTYSLTEDNCFRYCMEAVTTKPTPVDMLLHPYFNLAGHEAGKKTMCEHMVKIKANKYTDMDEETIPNGDILEVEGSPLDLRKMTNVGEALKPFLPLGFDHNYCCEYKPGMMVSQATIYHPPSGRWMEVLSNQPCIHFYTSHNMPDVEQKQEPPTIFGKCGAAYTKHGSFCMETHWYPNAVNHSNFPCCILNPGEKYCHTGIFKFGVCRRTCGQRTSQ